MILRKIKAMCQLLSGREHIFLSMSNSETENFAICFVDLACECLGQKQWHWEWSNFWHSKIGLWKIFEENANCVAPKLTIKCKIENVIKILLIYEFVLDTLYIKKHRQPYVYALPPNNDTKHWPARIPDEYRLCGNSETHKSVKYTKNQDLQDMRKKEELPEESTSRMLIYLN